MRRRVLLVALLPIPLLLAVAALLAWQLERVVETAHWVDHTNEVLSEIRLAERLLVDQETGLRGFLLTRNPAFLEPYERGRTQYAEGVERVRALTSDNPNQLNRLLALSKLYRTWFDSASPDRVSSPDRIPADMLTRKVAMDSMRSTLDEMSSEEVRLLGERREKARSTQRTGIGLAIGILAVAGILLVWLMRRSATDIDRSYTAALDQERRSRAAAQALAAEVAEQSQEMEVLYKQVRADRDQAIRRVQELERSR